MLPKGIQDIYQGMVVFLASVLCASKMSRYLYFHLILAQTILILYPSKVLGLPIPEFQRLDPKYFELVKVILAASQSR